MRSVLSTRDGEIEFDLKLGHCYGHSDYGNYYRYDDRGYLYKGTDYHSNKSIKWGKTDFDRPYSGEEDKTTIKIEPYNSGPPIVFKRLVFPEGLKWLRIGENTVVEDPVRLPHGFRAVTMPSNVIIENIDEFTGKPNVQIDIMSVNNWITLR